MYRSLPYKRADSILRWRMSHKKFMETRHFFASERIGDK